MSTYFSRLHWQIPALVYLLLWPETWQNKSKWKNVLLFFVMVCVRHICHGGKGMVWEWDVAGFMESTVREQSGKIQGSSCFLLFTFYEVSLDFQLPVQWIFSLLLNLSENVLTSYISNVCLLGDFKSSPLEDEH